MATTAMTFTVVLQADTTLEGIDQDNYDRVLESLKYMGVPINFQHLWNAYHMKVTHVEGTAVETHHEVCKHGHDVHDGCFTCGTDYAPEKCPERSSS